VVERKLIGGSCPNIACLPSKNIIHSAKVHSFARQGGEFGVETGPVATSMKGVQARKRAMVDGLRQMHLDRYRASGAELIMGQARRRADRPPERHARLPAAVTSREAPAGHAMVRDCGCAHLRTAV
jgi:pyruvate/2-oxoglutarate dehydrogenase complex dihydrolipoamide dehydrogenase (E3) component